MTMIIDCHGHYTVLPPAHDAWREEQKAAFKVGTPCPPYPAISDEDIRATIEANQLRLLKERGADLTIFSPRASAMAPHVGDESMAREWAQRCNDLIARVVGLYPKTFVGVCMLPQSSKADMAGSIAELERCVIHPPAADGPVLVSVLRKDGGTRCAGDDPRFGQLQSGDARDRRLLHRR